MNDYLMGFTKEDYDEVAKLSAQMNLETLKTREIGMLILCEAKEEQTTRLYINQFSRVDNILMKDGWWNTFTISDSPCKEIGYYMCEIKNFRVDRNGFLNMIVTIRNYLGTEVDVDSDSWKYFFRSGLFTQRYSGRFSHTKTRFNVEALHELFKTEIDQIICKERERLDGDYICADSMIAKYFLDKYLNGEITLSEIDRALDEKTDLEKLADDLTFQVSRYGTTAKNKYAEKYPLLVKKLPCDTGLFEGYYTTECTLRYLERKHYEYLKLKLGTEENLLNQVEAVLQYWVDVKKREKEERKKNRKNSIKAG